jgi:predicted negative regulator of RcsB-dependent stress response
MSFNFLPPEVQPGLTSNTDILSALSIVLTIYILGVSAYIGISEFQMQSIGREIGVYREKIAHIQHELRVHKKISQSIRHIEQLHEKHTKTTTWIMTLWSLASNRLSYSHIHMAKHHLIVQGQANTEEDITEWLDSLRTHPEFEKTTIEYIKPHTQYYSFRIQAYVPY